MKKTYHGGCHCGAVRFECELDFAGITSKCNCSICTKTRFWKAIAGTEEELAEAPVVYEDGRNDRWDRAPAETRYL